MKNHSKLEYLIQRSKVSNIMNKIKEKISVAYLTNNSVPCLSTKNKKYSITEFLQSKYKKACHEGKEMTPSINKN